MTALDLSDPRAAWMAGEPDRFGKAHRDPVLQWMVETAASDLTIRPGRPLMLEINGRLREGCRHALSPQEVMDLAVAMTGNEQLPVLLSGPSDVDDAVTVNLSRGHRHRFRFNATPIWVAGKRGISVTLRSIPATPPTLASMALPDDLVKAMFPQRGVGLVVGETGSGKSTLLAAMIRHIIEDPEANRKILTFESPIEYVYDDIVQPTAVVDQTAIPLGLPSFAAGLRGALRRHPGVILIGEARDRETIAAMMLAAASGHMTYSTVHANGFVETIQRLVNEFAVEEQAARAIGLLSSLRFIVCQTLVQARDPAQRRVALREYVVFDDEVKRDMMGEEGHVQGLTARARSVLRRHGRSFLQDAEAAYAAGRIGADTVDMFRRVERAGTHRSSAPSAVAQPQPDFDTLPILPETVP